jgi:hypothetical protein
MTKRLGLPRSRNRSSGPSRGVPSRAASDNHADLRSDVTSRGLAVRHQSRRGHDGRRLRAHGGLVPLDAAVTNEAKRAPARPALVELDTSLRAAP